MMLAVARWVTTLMKFNPERVLIGRENAMQTTLTGNQSEQGIFFGFQDENTNAVGFGQGPFFKLISNDYIVVDNLFMKSIGTSVDFDGVHEVENRTSYLFGAVTVEFYGAHSIENAHKFVNIATSQRGKDIAKSLGLTVYRPTRVNNIPQQTETSFYPRAEVDLNIRYNITNTEEVLRVETSQVTYMEG